MSPFWCEILWNTNLASLTIKTTFHSISPAGLLCYRCSGHSGTSLCHKHTFQKKECNVVTERYFRFYVLRSLFEKGLLCWNAKGTKNSKAWTLCDMPSSILSWIIRTWYCFRNIKKNLDKTPWYCCIYDIWIIEIYRYSICENKVFEVTGEAEG